MSRGVCCDRREQPSQTGLLGRRGPLHRGAQGERADLEEGGVRESRTGVEGER